MTEQPDETAPDTAEEAVADYETSEPRESRKGLLIGLAVGAAALLLGIAALVVFVLDADGPSDVVDDYFQALKDADIEEARSYLCEAERVTGGDDADAQAALAGLVAELEWEVTGEQVTGDTATVTVELKGLGETGEDTVQLVTESGDWKICGNTIE